MQIKQLITLTMGLIVFSSGGQAEDSKKENSITGRSVSLEIYGDLQTYYKIQTNYRTPLDGNDRFIADANDNSDAANTYYGEIGAGAKVRHGANNRSNQTSRNVGGLSLVARAGQMETDGTKWYKMIAVMQLSMDANDPDHPDTVDGERKPRVKHKDVWIRYAPVLPVGIKIGTQTVAATAAIAAIGHRYAGDQDNDFIFYTASALDEKPGISTDIHLSKDIELGLGVFDGMGDGSQIASGGSSSEAKNSAAWFKGKFGMMELTGAMQNISVGLTEDNSSNGILGEYQQKYSHTLMNTLVKANLGIFSPYFGYQTLSGDKVVNPLTSGTVNSSVSGFGEALEVQTDESRSMEGAFISMGVLADVGPGKLAMDYTSASSPAYGKTGSISPLLELDSATQINYRLSVAEDSNITLFYNHLQAKKDSNLRADIQHMKNNIAIAEGSVSDDAMRSLEQYTTLLETYRWTSTTSFGVSLEVKFGN
ncbi:MAG: hypothetical protein GY786_23990 [Proteobacteria bacterium]|nr:hypothetical protein [Pseudomonadota bacterium]